MRAWTAVSVSLAIAFGCASKGDKGDPGPAGARGDNGAQGPQGDTGAQGSVGAQGLKGDTGAQGPRGDTGAQGLKGDTGAQGDTGGQGLKGDTGAQGLKGDTGVAGNSPVVSAGGPLQLDGDGNLTVDTAGAADAGVLSATDWRAFAGKVSSVSPGKALTASGSGTEVTLDVRLGVDANSAAAGDDARLSDARAPTGGSGLYLQNQSASLQDASFAISGDGELGGLHVDGAAQVAGDLTVSGALHGDGSGLSGVALLSSPSASFSGALSAGSVTATGAVSAASVSAGGVVHGGSITSDGAISAGGALSCGAITSGPITATGLVSAGSFSTAGALTAGASTLASLSVTGAVTAASFSGDGSQLGGVISAGVPVASADPGCGSGNPGAIYFNSGDKTFRGCNGSSWVRLGHPPVRLFFDPPAVAFGSQTAAPVTASATLVNLGEDAATSLDLTVTGSDFSETGDDCGSTLAAGASCTVQLSFSSSGSLGPRSGTLTANAANTPAAVAQLTGNYAGAGGSAAGALGSCKAVKQANPQAGDARYFLSVGGSAAFQAQCDMTSDPAGAWTLIYNRVNAYFTPDHFYHSVPVGGGPDFTTNSVSWFIPADATRWKWEYSVDSGTTWQHVTTSIPPEARNTTAGTIRDRTVTLFENTTGASNASAWYYQSVAFGDLGGINCVTCWYGLLNVAQGAPDDPSDVGMGANYDGCAFGNHVSAGDNYTWPNSNIEMYLGGYKNVGGTGSGGTFCTPNQPLTMTRIRFWAQ